MSVTVNIVYAVWIPLAVVLFWTLGPRRAALIVLFAGFLLLPRDLYVPFHFGPFWVDKRTVTGIGLLAGILITDPRTLLRFRPKLIDLPMIAFVILPVASLAANGFADSPVTFDIVFRNFAEWSIPYLVGRLYFADRDGPRRIAVAVVIAGLCSIPIFVFEMVMGPRWYLSGLIYGIVPNEGMIYRMGGWRPEGFMTSALEVPTWLALSATMGVWLRLRRAWQLWKMPASSPPIVLSIATIACRGIYGYANLAIGTLLAGISHLIRPPIALIVLAAIPPIYVTTRVSGIWDGKSLVSLAARAGRPDTVAFRIMAEDSYVKKVVDHGAVFGFGGSESGIFDFWSQRHLTADGWWLHHFRMGGVVGLVAFFLAIFLVPAGLGLTLPIGRSGGATPGAMARGLSMFLILHSLDSLHNMNFLMPTPLMGGSLVGLFLVRRSCGIDIDPNAQQPRHKTAKPIAPLVITAVILVIIEILGRQPKAAMEPLPPSSKVALPPAASPVIGKSNKSG